jgi:hypothetical protein
MERAKEGDRTYTEEYAVVKLGNVRFWTGTLRKCHQPAKWAHPRYLSGLLTQAGSHTIYGEGQVWFTPQYMHTTNDSCRKLAERLQKAKMG